MAKPETTTLKYSLHQTEDGSIGILLSGLGYDMEDPKDFEIIDTTAKSLAATLYGHKQGLKVEAKWEWVKEYPKPNRGKTKKP